MSLSNSSVLNDLRSYSRHWLGEFIDLYQAEECLWQPKHPDYSNHTVRNKAYDKLVEKLKEVEPHPDRAMVVRKINSLRSAFRREYRKTSMKINYETRLWYYEKLLFIADQHPKRLVGGDHKMPKRSMPISFDEEDSLEFETEEQHLDASGSQNADGQHSQSELSETVTVTTADCVTLVKSEDVAQHHQQQHLHHHQQQQQPEHLHHQQLHHHQQQHNAAQPQHTTAVKVLEITSLDSNSQREIQQAVSSLEHQHHMQQQLQQQQSGQQATTQLAQIHHQQVPTIQIAREHLQPLFGNSAYATTTSSSHRQDDEYDAIGVNVASKLRVMNPTQRIIAEKLISDVLFNGQLDNLSINSSLTQ